MTKAVCSGSFDPVTNGHIDIFERASRIFDEVVVCVFHNMNKTPFFSVEERMALIKESAAHVKNLSVASFSGLLVNYMQKENINTIVRGVRSVADLEYEQYEARINSHLMPGVETVFLLTNPQYSFISSTGVREIAAFGGSVENLVPPCVAKAIVARQEKSIECQKFDLRF